MIEKAFDITERMLTFSLELARETGAKAVVVYADVFRNPEAAQAFEDRDKTVRIVYVTRSPDVSKRFQTLGCTAFQVPDIRLARAGQIKMAILVGFSRGIFANGDRLICLTGIAKSGVLDSVVCMKVGEEFEMFSQTGVQEISHHADSEVFERVVDIAVALANEGREGKPVGTTFLLGDPEKILQHTSEMILNPFRGYAPEERNILDPSLEPTIKELSTIDGAFVISEKGIVEKAGVYIRVAAGTTGLPRGLGARHHSAAAITSVTESTAITVSESTGTVTIFRGGKILMEIEAPRRIGPRTKATDEFFKDAKATGALVGDLENGESGKENP